MRQQLKTPRITHEVIKQLENAKVQITCLESDCSNYRLIKGVKCCKGALQETDLPEQESSVQQITGDDEFDDHTRKKGGPWTERGYPRKRYKDRIVAIRWQHDEERYQWSIHVLKGAVVEQDMLLFQDVIACLLYTSPSPRDATLSRMPSSA